MHFRFFCRSESSFNMFLKRRARTHARRRLYSGSVSSSPSVSCVSLYASSSIWSHGAAIIVPPLLWKSLSSSFHPTLFLGVYKPPLPVSPCQLAAASEDKFLLCHPTHKLQDNANSPRQQFSVVTINARHAPKQPPIVIGAALRQRRRGGGWIGDGCGGADKLKCNVSKPYPGLHQFAQDQLQQAP